MGSPHIHQQDAAHAAVDLFATLEDRCKEASGSHYPAGVFLDQKKHREQLALLYGKSQAASGPQCPPGPKTGFHIFLSYRRTNASDARALKQALEKFGYVIFMDLDRDGLGAGNFQQQLEKVLDDVPVVIMHCSDKPPGCVHREPRTRR